jgi:flagellar biosynthesis GTPase FlhF
MLIANPIYDVVFKSLMEDVEIARGIISTLIGEEILDLQLRPTDASIRIEGRTPPLTIYRLDFVAVASSKEKGTRKVLVEVQKAKLGSEVRRFREYLAKQYATPEVSTAPDGGRLVSDPPIIAIYILGFDLGDGVPAYCKVDRRYVDVINGGHAAVSDAFVEALSHDMYVVQSRRLSHTARNDLERLLAVFAQADFANEDSQQTIEFPDRLSKVKNRLFNRILRQLGKLAADSETRKRMDAEDRSYAEFEVILQKNSEELKAKMAAITVEKEEALRREAEERRQKEDAFRQKEAERRQKEAVIEKAVQALVSKGVPESEVRKMFS